MISAAWLPGGRVDESSVTVRDWEEGEMKGSPTLRNSSESIHFSSRCLTNDAAFKIGVENVSLDGERA